MNSQLTKSKCRCYKCKGINDDINDMYYTTLFLLCDRCYEWHKGKIYPSAESKLTPQEYEYKNNIEQYITKIEKTVCDSQVKYVLRNLFYDSDYVDYEILYYVNMSMKDFIEDGYEVYNTLIQYIHHHIPALYNQYKKFLLFTMCNNRANKFDGLIIGEIFKHILIYEYPQVSLELDYVEVE
jgi:hypothetical protein